MTLLVKFIENERVMGMSKIEKIGLIFAVLFVALAFVSVGIASAATIYVPDDYSTIQDTVNTTIPGYTIVVYNETNKENAVVSKSATGQVPTISTSSVTILDHTMCKDVDDVFDPDPIDRTNQFYTTDECAILWFKAKDVSHGDSFVVEWDDPDGQIYDLDIISVYAEMPVMKYATRLPILGHPPAGKPGRWEVTLFYSKGGVGEFKFTEYFTFIFVPVRLEEAVDNEELTWTTGGNANWFGQTGTYHYGRDAAQSGDISDGQETWMKTTVTGLGNLSFYWRVDSEYGHDYLRFYIDGVQQNRISGSTSWSKKTYFIGPGTHTLMWKYTKDSSLSLGEDCGWVDKVEFKHLIQSKVDEAKPGDTIIIKDGIYNENVKVNKRLTIRSENGSSNCIVKAADPKDSVFEITADYVSISGVTVTGTTGWHNAGIYLGNNVEHCDISNNKVLNNDYGIFLSYSSNNTLINNEFLNNGLLIWNSYRNTIENNTINGKPLIFLENVSDRAIADAGQVILVDCHNISVENLNLSNASVSIMLLGTDNCKIVNNTASNSCRGIYSDYSNNNIISNNKASNNKNEGISLSYSRNNTLFNNIISNNWNGIELYSSRSNTLANNNASNNKYNGIFLSYSSENNLTNNNISNNHHYGISLSSRNNNIYLNNFINNTDKDFSHSNNIWNSTSKIPYIYNGTNYENYLGNYWDDYKGRDADGDGIGDTPYSTNSDKDNYPLMQPWQNYFPEENEAKENKNPKLAFSSYYQPINISVNLSAPPYPLPLNLSNVTNINEITAEFWLSEREKELLRNNGFVIMDYGKVNDTVAPYEDMKIRGVPIFVATDTLLHLYHIQFNEILKGIEEREFFGKLVDMSKAMLEQSIQDYENFTDPDMKEAARRNVAYFAVALKLLQTPTEGYNGSEDIKEVNFTIPVYIKEDVDKEIENIDQHDDFHPSVIFNSDPNCLCGYPCCYCEDYSQYVPRGHYTRSEKLKRYFKAMMWYGRMAFLVKGCNGDDDDALISEQDAKLSTIQAALISSELPDVNVNNKTAQEIWDRIYSVTAFFVGTADDLTPYEYQDAMNNVFGAEYNVSKLSNGDNLLALKVELARLRSPEIYGGSGVCVVYPPITKEKLYECLNKTKGMRFMGQRFVPDSYMFNQLVSPAVGMYVGNNTPFTMCITDAGPARCFPRGLDIIAVLGSERAADILIEDGDTEYAGINTSYDKQLEELKSQFAGFDVTEWNRNLYWSWLYTLKPLLKQFEDGYPTFMQTRAWQEKALQTSLASWTELRHDTILYAKQSYTPPLLSMPPQPKPVVGYVEPVPEFYARLLALTEMTENGLVDLDVLNETEKVRLQSLERILERLINISEAELENKELSEGDYEFIRNFGENLDYVVAGVNNKGKETTIVADVHTDCNTGMVLEEGVGYVNLIIVAYNVPDGRIIVGAGPVFSYYEFKQPMDDRLTDKKWKEMLQRNPPDRPGWVEGIGG